MMYDIEAKRQSKERWKRIAKPLYGLGRLEDAISSMAGMYGDVLFPFGKKALIVMCSDNGVVREGVTQTGQEVTAVVAANFLRGKTSVCQMAQLAGVDVYPVDIGIVRDVEGLTVRERKAGYGTESFLNGPAMTREQAEHAVQIGITVARELYEKGYRLFAVGEMGIGNTTTSAACACVLLDRAVEETAGRGAGLSDEGFARKTEVIRRGIEVNQPDPDDVIDVLSKVGGYDLCGLTGVFIGAAQCGVPVIIDGAITAVAALCAQRLRPGTADYMLASHTSKEPVSPLVLNRLGLTPFLDCDLCLGEGSGAVMLIPLLEMAHKVYTDMPTFEEIEVEQYEDYGNKKEEQAENRLPQEV